MLTGRETVAEVASATGHRRWSEVAVAEVLHGGGTRRTTWGQLLVEVRRVALGLVAEWPEGAVALPADAPAAERARALLVAAATGRTLELAGEEAAPGGGRTLDAEAAAALAAVGAAIDDAEPDRFEALVAEVATTAPLLRSGGATHSHASLLVAARSLAEGARVAPGGHVLVDLPLGVGRLVAGVLVPALVEATSWALQPGVPVEAAGPLVRPTLVVLHGDPLGPAGVSSPGAAGRGAPAAGVGAVPHRVVVRTGPAVAPWPAGTGFALAVASAGGIVTGFGPPGSVGRPLPGASVAIDDDGQVLVRSGGVATDAPGRRPDGWLPTGLHGRIEAGALHLDAPDAETASTDELEPGATGAPHR